MNLWSRIRSWLGTLLRRSRMESEMDQELRFHIETFAADLVRGGVPMQGALRVARIEFGDVERVKEEGREARGLSFFDELFQDLRYGQRVLRKSPGFALVAVLTLALGIGATTAIFSVVNAVLLRPLAMEDPSRVVLLQEQWKSSGVDVSVGNFNDVKKQSSSYLEVSSSNNASFNVETRGVPERVDGEIATFNYFATFGVPPIAGRVFTTDEDRPGHAPVIVVSERFWRNNLQADSAVIGKAIRVNGLPTTIVGVMPKTFDPLLSHSDLWVPAAFTPTQLAEHDDHYLDVIARLKPGVAMAQAQSELNVIARRLQQQYPLDDADRGFR